MTPAEFGAALGWPRLVRKGKLCWVRLCDEHRRQVPEKSYRLRFIPVGATIMLDGEQ